MNYKNKIFLGNIFKIFVENDEDFKESRKKFNKNFYINYNQFFTLYVEGKWIEAINKFKQIQMMLIENNTIKSAEQIKLYIEKLNLNPPIDWIGGKKIKF